MAVGGFEAVWRCAWEDRRPGFGVYVPADPDAPLEALDEATFAATDERMPYFASLWPAGVSLAAHVLAAPGLAGRRVLELGCGVGAPGLAAAVGGAEVGFVDWEPLALELVGHSAAVLGVVRATRAVADWRAFQPDGRFDLVLGADLLYEARNVGAVRAVLARVLAPGGEAWIADPGRDGFEALLASAAAPGPGGLGLLGRRTLPPRAHGGEVHLARLGRYGDAP